MLRRTSEALRLLLLLSQHHFSRLAHALPPAHLPALRSATLHSLVCEEQGDELASQLIAALMQVGGREGGREEEGNRAEKRRMKGKGRAKMGRSFGDEERRGGNVECMKGP